KYGPPSPLDQWIKINLAQSTQNLRLAELSRDEVECTLTVKCILAPSAPDDYFGDPPTYQLYLALRLSPLYTHVTEEEQSSPLALLDQQYGFGGGMRDPEWTELDVDTPYIFRQDRGYMANLF
ncbi:hypothetical protein K474DRAFT_1556095, partial [Panus rudis PR-1116 ss-1]